MWKKISNFRPVANEKITEIRSKEILGVLETWYHEEANAIYMSWGTTANYFLALRCLKERPPDSDKIRSKVSLLRTHLKVDLGIYSKNEAGKKLPSAY